MNGKKILSNFMLMISITLLSITNGESKTPTIADPDPENLVQTGPWIQKAAMPIGRHSFAASVVNDRIYAIGGRYTDDMLTEYDPATDTWITKSSMPTSRMILASGVVNGKIYAIGGLVEAFSPALSTVEQYDPVTDNWTQKKNMSTSRLGPGVSVVDGKIYAIGGMTSGSDFWSGIHSTVEVYDPVTYSWSAKTDMPTPRVWFSTSVVDGKIYAIGGALVTTAPLSTVEVYDPATDIWITKAPMPTARMGHAAAVVNGIIYIIGGGTVSAFPGGFSTVEAYDPATDTWTSKADLPAKRAFLSASVVGGKIYAIGGIPTAADPHLHGVNTVYEYDPSKDLTSVSNNGLNIQRFYLNQNYPNPFNSTTTIQFNLSRSGFVTLKVFDCLGNELQTLVNKNMNAGRYLVNFDASSYASGTYFYKLQAGEFEETRKMLLMR